MKKRNRKQKRNDLLPMLLIGAGALLVLGVLVWQALQTTRPVTSNPGQAPAVQTPATVEQVQRVTITDAKAALDAGEAVFLDVRDPQSFDAGHIPGAVNIPLALLENRASELDPNQWIITICT